MVIYEEGWKLTYKNFMNACEIGDLRKVREIYYNDKNVTDTMIVEGITRSCCKGNYDTGKWLYQINYHLQGQVSSDIFNYLVYEYR